MQPAQPRLLRRLLPAALSALVFGAAPAAQNGAERPARPDQVVVSNPRTDGVSSLAGVVTENSLRQLVLESRSGERSELASDVVQRITFGEVPESFTEAEAFAEGGDYRNAAAKYQTAARDTEARAVVRAEARLRAAEALLLLGAGEPAHLEEAIAETQRFQSEFPEARGIPRARALEARAALLAGDAAKAAELYRSLYQEAAGAEATRGYSLEQCYEAGAEAAFAYMAAGDAERGRELFAQIGSAVSAVLADLPETSPARHPLERVQAQARLGEGFALLATDKTARAKAFFESQLSGAGGEVSTSLRLGAQLGLGEALLAEGQHRAAQIELAQVSALETADRDRLARAQLGLARCALALQDPGAQEQARVWLESIRARYPDTPSGPAALELLRTP